MEAAGGLSTGGAGASRIRSECIGTGLSSQQRMLRKHRGAREGKTSGKLLEQALPDMGGPKPATALPLQGGHRLAVLGAPAHQAKGLQVRIDVKREAVLGDPIMDCDADAGNGPCANPNAGTVPTSLAVNIEISQQSLNHLAQPIDIGLQAQPETIERQNGIEGQLAGNVQQAATSPIHPADAPAPDLKLTRIA